MEPTGGPPKKGGSFSPKMWLSPKGQTTKKNYHASKTPPQGGKSGGSFCFRATTHTRRLGGSGRHPNPPKCGGTLAPIMWGTLAPKMRGILAPKMWGAQPPEGKKKKKKKSVVGVYANTQVPTSPPPLPHPFSLFCLHVEGSSSLTCSQP